ncbi:MAG TPA: tRNA (adenosine(37)-N6)-dimethylallyltransferase MiaA, partial [Terriglobales bacterium]|nr:tRNA (adenosine(37)-N6)-dimethylallyltransferase MiaA [Terriglobales bacterium]
MADSSRGMLADSLLIAIVGPTGSGKTALSIEIAQRFGGEIVNCDSVAIYREFEIGTAKPSAEERALAPHHLMDILDPEQQMTAGEYARIGREVLEQIKTRGKMPIIVGGTGFYLRALLEGLFEGPERSEELRARLRGIEQRRGAGYLHRILRRFDQTAAERIHGNDVPKVIRAIEVCLQARQPMTELWQQGRDPLTGFRILRIGLNPERNALYSQINRRCEQMFEAGLIEETARLMEKY